MKIIIAGAGEVGTHLAKLLSNENLDIVLIDTDVEKLNWLDANYNLMTIAGSPTSLKILKQAGIEEADFLARLDEMTEQAFDDQCTGANPRYPLMSAIKSMYLNAYYGK